MPPTAKAPRGIESIGNLYVRRTANIVVDAAQQVTSMLHLVLQQPPRADPNSNHQNPPADPHPPHAQPSGSAIRTPRRSRAIRERAVNN